MKKNSSSNARLSGGTIKMALKKNIHLPLLQFKERIAGRHYAKNPRKRAEELFQKAYGRPIDWERPTLFAEKIRWIQFNTDISYWSILADKFKARSYVADKGHGDILIPLLGQWESADDIDFNTLPDAFVIKPNNGCSDLFIITDKKSAPLKKIRRQLARSMSRVYGAYNAETQYALINPCIFAEKIMTEPDFSAGVPDYKFFCVNGEPMMCRVCTDRNYNGPDTKRVTMYDMDWKRHDEWMEPEYAAGAKDIPCPASFEKMKAICRDLSAGMPFVRLDLYDDHGQVRFGEFTFTPAALKRIPSISDTALQYIADRISLSPASAAPTLSVTISTIGKEGIDRVAAMQLPEVEGVEYVVSWQKHEDAPVPQSLQREDIRVVRTPTIGLSHNRNSALSRARGEIILIADDDLSYTSGQLLAVINTFCDNPAVDIASFRYRTPALKRYPERDMPFEDLPKGYVPASIEIAFRRKIITGADALTFNPLLGIGAPYLSAGEEDFFLMQAASRGYRGHYFPIEITTHHGVATGGRKVNDNGVIRANGALIALRRPLLWPVAITAAAMHMSRAGRAPFLRAVREMVKGAIYGMRHLKV
ncbi:MAG: glycosyltransferase [Bacteroidales bacterium]|nr:glycosyltransferase [Bacteroidales bacterium]